MSRTPILAFDLATSTGWALRARDGRVTSGEQRFELKRGESPGMRWLRFRAWLREMIALGELGAREGVIGLIAYERPIVAGRGFSAGITRELAAVVQEECASRELHSTDVAAATLKKHATGKGNSKKDAMAAAARARWGETASGELGEDQADALCVLAWALDEIGEG